MNDTCLLQILNSFNDLMGYVNNCRLVEIFDSILESVIFVDKWHETASGAELGDNVAVCFTFVDI